jgi:hypothetical protein
MLTHPNRRIGSPPLRTAHRAGPMAARMQIVHGASSLLGCYRFGPKSCTISLPKGVVTLFRLLNAHCAPSANVAANVIGLTMWPAIQHSCGRGARNAPPCGSSTSKQMSRASADQARRCTALRACVVQVRPSGQTIFWIDRRRYFSRRIPRPIFFASCERASA